MKSIMKIKKGDTVTVMTGSEKGKKGTVLKVYADKNQVVVEGVRVTNTIKRPNIRGAKAQVVPVAKPIHASNVMVVDSKTKKPSRIGYAFIAGKKTRITKASGQEVK